MRGKGTTRKGITGEGHDFSSCRTYRKSSRL